MNYEELAFVNQQLAGMLKSGIPLEGALRQLCANMRRGPCRTELEALERDLARGVPLKDALASEILEAYQGLGSAIRKRDEVHKMAQANKAFAHFRW